MLVPVCGLSGGRVAWWQVPVSGCPPDADGEHVEDASSLQPAEQHDDSDDTERVEGKLLAQLVH